MRTLPSELVADLRDSGHDADTVFDENLAGAKDPVLLAVASSEKRVLLTLDKGLGHRPR